MSESPRGEPLKTRIRITMNTISINHSPFLPLPSPRRPFDSGAWNDSMGCTKYFGYLTTTHQLVKKCFSHLFRTNSCDYYIQHCADKSDCFVKHQPGMAVTGQTCSEPGTNFFAQPCSSWYSSKCARGTPPFPTRSN